MQSAGGIAAAAVGPQKVDEFLSGDAPIPVQDQVGQKIVSAEALLTLELPLPPATGDGFPLWPALALAVLSGTVLLIDLLNLDGAKMNAGDPIRARFLPSDACLLSE